jgi:hypothetical protein
MSAKHENHPATQDGPPGVPGWVKGLAFGAVMVLLAIVLVMLVVGGDHGPGRHGG